MTQDASKRNARAPKGGKIWIFRFIPRKCYLCKSILYTETIPVATTKVSVASVFKVQKGTGDCATIDAIFKLITLTYFTYRTTTSGIRVRSVALVLASFCSPAARRGFPARRLLRGVSHCESRHRWLRRRLIQGNRDVIWREVVSCIVLFPGKSH